MAVADRARGALYGLAVGDALGMPTQFLSREVIAGQYGVVENFEPGPDNNPISKGMPAGRVTDDTDQAVILGRLLIEGGGRVDEYRLADELIAWEQRMIGLGSLDLLGPSTRKAVTSLQNGASPEETGTWGDTNGAAMRIAPVGIAFSAEPLDRLVRAVAQAGKVTHNTQVANAGASAVAAAVSTGISGGSMNDAVQSGIAAAKLGVRIGNYTGGADVAARIPRAIALVAGEPPDRGLDLIYRLVGTGVSTQEAVPAAFAICAMFPDDPWAACTHAASLGGDCDTVAAIAGAISGAIAGAEAIPAEARKQIQSVNPGLHLDELAEDLLALREQGDTR